MLAALAVMLWIDAHQFASVRVYRTRNFYGVLNVYRHVHQDPTLTLMELMHGRVAHGMQFEHPSRAKLPTLYFSPESGAGGAMAASPPCPPPIDQGCTAALAKLAVFITAANRAPRAWAALI